MSSDNDPQYSYCAKCGKVSFLCRCDEGDGECADCAECSDDITAEEIDFCVICAEPISADATPGYEMHFCEDCAGTVCAKCACPVVDEYGEMYFICLNCMKENREQSNG